MIEGPKLSRQISGGKELVKSEWDLKRDLHAMVLWSSL